MFRITFYGLCTLFFTVSVAQATQVEMQLQGLSGDLQNNVRIGLQTITSEEVTLDSRFQVRLTDSIEQSLRALGYYQPRISFTRSPEQVGLSGGTIKVRIEAGLPIKIASSQIKLNGAGHNDPTYLAWIAKGRPKSGTILNHGQYDTFKSGFATIAMQKGYFDSEWLKSQLGVSEELNQAWWTLSYQTGPRYRFGTVNFTGSQIQTAYLQKLIPFNEGEDYDSRSLAELNRRLSATGWFSTVVAAPDFDQVIGKDDSRILPINTSVKPATKNSIETGIGYSTDVGPHVKANWKRPWVNNRGHSMGVSTYLSQLEQQLDFSYKVPLLKSPLEQYYLFQGGIKRTDLNDTKIDASTLALSRYWDNETGWQKAINLRWSLSHYTQGLITDTTMLLYPGVSLNRTRSRGGLMPDWGDTQRYSIDISNTLWGSDIDFLIFQAQNVWIRTLAEKHRFVVRGNLGWMDTDSFNRVPPDLRFFAGGDRSIRGYKYKNVSPRDSDNKLTGASKMATGSLEYQYNVTGKWWGAVFLDGGEAVNDFNRKDFKTGAGFGIRWASPVGPIKFDIAKAIGDENEHSVQFYIGLGPEL